jgi:pantothenate kinase-related protein Tda10
MSKLSELFDDVKIEKSGFLVDWHYAAGKGMESALIEERVSGTLLDAAYPTITEGVHKFIDRYLSTDLPVLVVHGPPGTGKTRLIRGILAELARRAKERCRVMFTADDSILERDECCRRPNIDPLLGVMPLQY